MAEQNKEEIETIRPINDTSGEFKISEIEPLNFFKNLEDLIQVFKDTASVNSSSIRAINPKRLYDQIKLENTGYNRRLWIYIPGDNWRKVQLS